MGIFLKNPPDGAGHGLKYIKSKKRQQFYFKNFLRPSTLLLCEKIICLWKNTEKWTFSFFIGDLCHQILPRTHMFEFEEQKIWWRKSPKKMTKFTFLCFFTKKYFFFIKAKLTVSKSFWSKSAVAFLIRCILDHGQRHLVDFWEKFPMYLDFIWIEQISYNFWVLFQIVWSRTSNFKHKSFSTEGWPPTHPILST